MRPWIFTSLLLVVAVTDAICASSSCVPAQPTVSPWLLAYYFQKLPAGSTCSDIIGNSTTCNTKSYHDYGQRNTNMILQGIKAMEVLSKKTLVRESCLKVFKPGLCRNSFPKCDTTSSTLHFTRICRETCDDVAKQCDKEYEMAKQFDIDLQNTSYPRSWRLEGCTKFPWRNGGDIPACYYSRHLNTETDKLKASDCYYGNGLGYYGNVSITHSGHVCQSWSLQCPHRHGHPVVEYPELVNASNWCRNPGGQAPNGPWCYTTNTSMRWEYCDVSRCPPPVPSRTPFIVQAFASGSSKISIEWRAVPPPFIHGQHCGYRVLINTAQQNPFTMEHITRPQLHDYQFRGLQPSTNYSVSVRAVNENGDGPWSQRVFVSTMPKNFVAGRFSVTLNKELFSRELLNRTSTTFKKLAFVVKTTIMNSLQNPELTEYKIYTINIIRFVEDRRVRVDFEVTAELFSLVPSWSVTQDMTRRILRASTWDISGFIVKVPPPPPANLSQSDVQMTSATISWSVPRYHEAYQITNYSVQYKKADTAMSYYDAVKVSSAKSEIQINNLDSDTAYLMRAVSLGAYGSQPSPPIVVKTQAKPASKPISALAIVLPIITVMGVMISASGLYLRWRYAKRKQRTEMRENLNKFIENPYDSDVNWFKALQIEAIKEWREISRDDLTMADKLGSGAFGVVMKGYLKTDEGDETVISCAVKMMVKASPTERDLRDICNEINFMSLVGDHPNIVSLIGACTLNGPPLLVVKFASNGCLLDYIKENRARPHYENTLDDPACQLKVITKRETMKFAHEIAQGMAYLEQHRFVHRDLAARNILLGKNMVAMVSDFGLSRDVYEIGAYENTSGGILPVRWMALESLQYYTYTSKSDVWSYGVLMWEIESEGLMPYAGLSGQEIVERLNHGYRLEKPCNTPRDIYSIMWKCWNSKPDERPTFADLVYTLGGLLVVVGQDENIFPPNNKLSW